MRLLCVEGEELIVCVCDLGGQTDELDGCGCVWEGDYGGWNFEAGFFDSVRVRVGCKYGVMGWVSHKCSGLN